MILILSHCIASSEKTTKGDVLLNLPRPLRLFNASLILSMAIPLGGMTSCGKEDDKEEGTSPLDGTWQTDCQVDDNLNGNTVEYIFKESVVSIKGSVYEDETCTTKIFSMDLSANFTTGEAYGEGIKLDLTSQKISITHHNDQAVAVLNTQCGYEYFTKDKATEITVDGCDGEFASLIEPYHGLYKIDGNKLYQDKSDENFDGSSEEKRPKTLETIYATKK